MNSVRPLHGVKVVDLTANIAGPFAGAVLADLGADVLHVENVTGDDSRRMTPTVGDASAYWHVVNRGKRVIALDIRESADRAALDDLIASCDVFITNLRPGKLEQLGLDAGTVRAAHPRLIHGSLSAYGNGGDERDRAGYDGVLQARVGIASVTGEHDGPPVRAGVSILDVGSGTWLALGVLAALLHRERTGEGCDVGTSLFETGMNWVGYHVAANQITGEASERFGSGHPAFAPYGIYAAADGQVCLGIGSDALFAKLCEALACEELTADPRYSSNEARVKHDAQLRGELEQRFSKEPARVLVARLVAAGLPCDVVQRPEALLSDPQARAVSAFRPVTVGNDLEIEIPGLPIRLNGERPSGSD